MSVKMGKALECPVLKAFNRRLCIAHDTHLTIIPEQDSLDEWDSYEVDVSVDASNLRALFCVQYICKMFNDTLVAIGAPALYSPRVLSVGELRAGLAQINKVQKAILVVLVEAKLSGGVMARYVFEQVPISVNLKLLNTALLCLSRNYHRDRAAEDVGWLVVNALLENQRFSFDVLTSQLLSISSTNWI